MNSHSAVPQAWANVIFDFDLTIFPEESTVRLIHSLIGNDQDLKNFVNEYGKQGKSLADKISDMKNFMSIMSKVKKDRLQHFTQNLRQAIHPAFNELIIHLKNSGIKPHVISSGYFEIISPFINHLGIPSCDIAANRLFWIRNQAIFIVPSRLNTSKGKAEIVRHWKASGKLKGPVIMVGDGQADRNVYLQGQAEGFIQANYYTKPIQYDFPGNFSISNSPDTLKQQLCEMFENISHNNETSSRISKHPFRSGIKIQG